MAPRNRANQENQVTNVQETSGTATTTTTINPTRKLIDARDEQEFPSLGNAPINIRPTVTLNMRPSTSGLARTKENFPALGGGGSSNAREPFKPPPNPTSNASTLLFKTPTKTNASSKNAINKAKPAAAAPIKSHDFPTLSASSNKRANLGSDMIERPLSLNSSTVSAKHKVLVQAYDTPSSAANMLANQKIKTIQRAETKPQTLQQEHVPSIKSKENFPALSGGASASSSASAPQWLNGSNGSGSKKQPQMSKKLKVAPAPILPTNKFNETIKKDIDSNKKSKSNEQTKLNQNDKTKDAIKADNGNCKKIEKDKMKHSDDNAKKTKEKNEKNNNGNKNEKKTLIDSSPTELNGSGTTLNGSVANSYSSVAHFTMPPPGFPAKKNEKSTSVPPGFENLSKDSKTNSYMSPKNALQRNQVSICHLIDNREPYLCKHNLFFLDFSKSFHEITESARSR